MLKNEYWTVAPYVKPQIKKINKQVLKMLNGWQSLYKNIKPVVPVKNTTREEVIDSFKWKAYLNNMMIITLNTTVRAGGKLFPMTFKRKFPLTSSLLGSKAKTKDGIPIVNIVIRVSWIGIKKYFEEANIQINIKINVNIVLINNKEALLSILLIVLLPSFTT